MASFPHSISVGFVSQNIVRPYFVSRGLLSAKTTPEGFVLLFRMMGS